MDIFKFDSYKEFLRRWIDSHAGERGYQAKLAKAAGCQASYLSQVLTAKADLSQDQILNLAQFLGFDENETEYLLTMLLRSRSATPSAKRFCDAKLARLKAERQRLSDRVGAGKGYAKAVEGFYHSSWVHSAVHIATSVEGQTVENIATTFQLPTSEVIRVLKTLEKLKLVKAVGDQWRYNGGATHLREDSVMTEINHANWRQKSLANIPLKKPGDLRYTSVFSVSKKDSALLREELLKTIENWRKKIRPSQPEVTFAFLADFFAV